MTTQQTTQQTKVCSTCKETLSVDKFVKQKATKDGLNSQCKKCKNKRHQAVRDLRKQQIKDGTFVYPKSKVCTTCKEDKPASEYNQQLDNSTGLYTQCRECQKKSFQSPTKDKRTYNTLTKLGQELSFSDEGYVQAHCANAECNKLHLPTKYAFVNRREELKKTKKMKLNPDLAGRRLYCSDQCKIDCDKFNLNINVVPTDKQESEAVRACQSTTRNALIAIQKDKEGHTYCEKCGAIGAVELHHTLEVAKYGKNAIASDGHILICNECHKKATATCRKETVKEIVVPKLDNQENQVNI